MHILLTRPIEDCKDLIIKFKNLGHVVSHMPVIKIEKLNYEIKKVSEFKAIIFTSANAIKYFDTKQIDKKILIFCVGEATERKVRSSGFQNIISAEGNVNNLKELIIQNFEPSSGKMLYVSGETISNELDKDLSSHGYTVERIITYSAQFIENLDEKLFSITFLSLNKSYLREILSKKVSFITLKAKRTSYYCKDCSDLHINQGKMVFLHAECHASFHMMMQG